MVHLIEDYYAIPNNMGFTLCIDKKKEDSKGNKVYETIGYCGSFEEVIFLLKRKVVDRKLQKRRYELSEALQVIRETTVQIQEAMRGVRF